MQDLFNIEHILEGKQMSKNKNKALKIFGEAFLRAMVIVMGVAIIAFGIFFIVRVATGGGSTEVVSEDLDEDVYQSMLDEEIASESAGLDEAAASTTEKVTTEATTEEQIISSKDLKIVVLNSTNTKGLAKAWVEKLTAAGFTNVQTGNYQAGALTSTKIIAVSEGTGKDLVAYFSGATLENGNLTSGYVLSDTSATTSDIDIFIIIGTNDDIVQ